MSPPRPFPPPEFWCWLISYIHRAILKGSDKKTRRSGKSVFTSAFQGSIKVRTVRAVDKKNSYLSEADHDSMNDSVLGGQKKEATPGAGQADNIEIEETTQEVPFLQLTVDIPQKPLFKDDSKGGLVIPQENLMDLMNKFDGKTVIDGVSRKGAKEKKQYNVKEMPKYLVLNLKRFTKTKFGIEKNPTIVTFPVEGVDFGGYVVGGGGGEENVDSMKVSA